MLKTKNGFTLAETLVVLVVLGVIASLTIPALVRNHTENANRSRIKKAMAVYEAALNKMVIENNLKSDTDIDNWASADCSNTRAYFKAASDGQNACSFRTSDGLWWNITDIKNPLISLRGEIQNVQNAQATAKDTTDNTIYAMVGHIDNLGILRIDDLAYEQINGTEEAKADMKKLYGFINNKKSEESECDISCKIEKYKSIECVANDPEPKKCKKISSLFNGRSVVENIYDENGTDIYYRHNYCDEGGVNCRSFLLEVKNEHGHEILNKYCDYNNENNCSYEHKYKYLYGENEVKDISKLNKNSFITDGMNVDSIKVYDSNGTTQLQTLNLYTNNDGSYTVTGSGSFNNYGSTSYHYDKDNNLEKITLYRSVLYDDKGNVEYDCSNGRCEISADGTFSMSSYY